LGNQWSPATHHCAPASGQRTTQAGELETYHVRKSSYSNTSTDKATKAADHNTIQSTNPPYTYTHGTSCERAATMMYLHAEGTSLPGAARWVDQHQATYPASDDGAESRPRRSHQPRLRARARSLPCVAKAENQCSYIDGLYVHHKPQRPQIARSSLSARSSLEFPPAMPSPRSHSESAGPGKVLEIR